MRTLVNGEQKAGRHMAEYDGSDLTSGIYLIRMEAANFRAVRKLTFMK